MQSHPANVRVWASGVKHAPRDEKRRRPGVAGEIISRLVEAGSLNRPPGTLNCPQMASISNFFEKVWRATPFSGDPKPFVAVIELAGAIGMSGPGRKGLSLARLEKTIEAAFAASNLSAVALAVNSPGGSPVQSRLIYRKIRALAEEKSVPVLTFIEDVGASGGYILALAGDEIYADESSVVGSIGVISAGFGFQEAIARIGVDRRVYTAGASKSMLDPFKHEDAGDVRRLKMILNDLHEQFIDLVKKHRGAKIEKAQTPEDEDIFSGLIWTGVQAKERGLIDGIAQLGDFVRERYGKDVRIKRFSPESGSMLKRLIGGDAARGGLIDPEAVLEAAETRALWARYGL